MADCDLESFGEPIRAIVFGAGGGIGGALMQALTTHPKIEFCRGTYFRQGATHTLSQLDITDEAALAHYAQAWRSQGPFHLILNATGFLHSDQVQPEKRVQDLSASQLMAQFSINTIGPALLYKHFLPLLAPKGKAVFAHLSARVGSISDNQIGGWYGYRAAKAAQNMITRTASIEWARRRAEAILVGLHPGTVDTALSKPFQRGVSESQLVTPAIAAQNLLRVIDQLTPAQTGQVLAWDGQIIPY